MFLKQCTSGHLVEVIDQAALFDPHSENFRGRLNIGEEIAYEEDFAKSYVCFLSGEAFPRCWIDTHYRDAELRC
ncbi:MAG: acetyltransferase [Acidihalobacter sp.]